MLITIYGTSRNMILDFLKHKIFSLLLVLKTSYNLETIFLSNFLNLFTIQSNNL
jgi:hypothetical protein